jgi:uncharacterized caspase-like protein
MKTISTLLLSCFMLFCCAFASPSRAEDEKRIAFVVGNAAYQVGPLATPANDAGLIAQTLQAAGFDVSGARDLDGEALRAAFRDFLDKAQASGPDAVAFVYLAGYGLQLEGENYFVPVDAKIAAASDVAVEALRISDYTKRLAGLPLKASFIVVDGARANPFAKTGQPLAGGLALTDADPNMVVAFNAAPGTVAPEESGPYGAYARALAEMVREGGLSPSEVFDGVRLRVSEETKGAQVPWSAARISGPFIFFQRMADAPSPALETGRMIAMGKTPLGELGAKDAYAAAIERDTLPGYEEFLAAYPSDPLAGRVRALLAARREAITWRHTCRVNTPDGYWSYLDRYPHGPHAAEAQWRLDALAAPAAPPPSFTPIAYDVPPPPPAEFVYVERPVLILGDPVFGFVPPPPIVFLAPPPAYLVYPPPVMVADPFVLPVPAFIPFPAYINPPPFVAPPAGNMIFTNIHSTTIINNTNVLNQGSPGFPGARGASIAAGVAAGAAAGAIAARVALPPSVARKADLTGGQWNKPGQAMPGAQAPQKLQPGLPGAAQVTPGHALPGQDGKPLPAQAGKPRASTQQSALPGTPGTAQSQAGHTFPATNGQSLPGQVGKPGTPSQGKTQGGPAGALANKPNAQSQNKPQPRALHSSQGLARTPSGPGAPGTTKPGRPITPEAFSPKGAKSPSGIASSAVSHQPALPGPGSALAPAPQQSQRPQQFQQERQPPQTFAAPGASRQPQPLRPAQQTFQPPHMPQQQAQQGRPPQQTFQTPRKAPPAQQGRPAQQQRNCGQPNLPPCR